MHHDLDADHGGRRNVVDNGDGDDELLWRPDEPLALSPLRGNLSVGTARLAAFGTALLVVVFLVFSTPRAAFTSSTNTPGNSVATGTIALVDDDTSSAMFDGIANLGPLTVITRCIRVDYTGTIDAMPIKLFAPTAPSGSLSSYLDMNIEIGAATGDTFPSCTSFTPTATLFNGTLDSFASTHAGYSTGLATWDPSGPSSRSFRFTMVVRDDPLAAGLAAGWALTWEARSN
jgi:hypothetical protein